MCSSARGRLNSAVPGIGGQAHHIIPWELRGHDLVQRASRGGFNMNGGSNGIRLGPGQHWGSHDIYNNAVRRKLDDLWRNNPGLTDEQYARLLSDYMAQLRKGIDGGSKRLH